WSAPVPTLSMATPTMAPSACSSCKIMMASASRRPPTILRFGITPYGTEALGVMRIEKGHVAGNEIDGRTTARDLGLAKLMSTRKDYIGRIMSNRSALLDPDRPTLTGFKPADKSARLRAGAHFVPVDGPASADNDQGVMTSVAFSPTLGHWIGLGLLTSGPERIGGRGGAVDPGGNNDGGAEVCSPGFVDPQRGRLRG